MFGLMTACTGYRQDMAQGQDLTSQQVATIHVGMTRQSVIDALGAPVLHTIYDPNKLVYVYTMLPVHGRPYARQLVLTFNHDKLTAKHSEGYQK